MLGCVLQDLVTVLHLDASEWRTKKPPKSKTLNLVTVCASLVFADSEPCG
ncbi:hypothetical protein Nmel_007282 [Mimus melanotis]